MKNLNIKAIDVVEISIMEKMNNSGGDSVKVLTDPNGPYYIEPPFLPKAPDLEDFFVG
jgi:hypothetical protein